MRRIIALAALIALPLLARPQGHARAAMLAYRAQPRPADSGAPHW